LTLPSTPSPFNAPPPTQIYTLSLHDALPIYDRLMPLASRDYTFSYLLPAEASGLTLKTRVRYHILTDAQHNALKKEYGLTAEDRSEEHTSELQSLAYLVCRLLLEKKKKIQKQ